MNHIFLKIIETDFVNSQTNSNKKGWMKNERKITTQKMIKMDYKILNKDYTTEKIINNDKEKKIIFKSFKKLFE